MQSGFQVGQYRFDFVVCDIVGRIYKDQVELAVLEARTALALVMCKGLGVLGHNVGIELHALLEKRLANQFGVGAAHRCSLLVAVHQNHRGGPATKGFQPKRSGASIKVQYPRTCQGLPVLKAVENALANAVGGWPGALGWSG